MNQAIEFTSDITVRLIEKAGGDHLVVAAAKVSTSGEEALQFTDPAKAEDSYGLIRYLMKHRHGTPFEHSYLTLFVHAPIFVWREWHRHRIGFSYNEESGRYKTLDPVFYVPPRDRPMIKVVGWKPGRPKFLTLEEKVISKRPDWAGESARIMADGKYAEILEDMKKGYAEEYERYLRQLGRDLDSGLARDNLPVGIYSSCWVTCNPRSLMAFLSLRTHEPTAQAVSYPLYEIEVAARQVEQIFAEHWPLTYRAFLECGRVAP